MLYSLGHLEPARQGEAVDIALRMPNGSQVKGARMVVGSTGARHVSWESEGTYETYEVDRLVRSC